MGKAITEVYWGALKHTAFGSRPLYLAATNKGLCHILWPNESFDKLRTWVLKKIPDALLIEDQEQLSVYVRQLEQYLDGKRKSFDLPFDMRGTAFQISVWQALTHIPYGQTRSYSEIAEKVGNPNAVRAVGAANGANPIPIVVPCHRVIGKNAALTGFAGGLETKEMLLQLEGFHDFTTKGHERFRFASGVSK